MKSLQIFRNRIFSYYFFAALIGVFGEGIFGLTSIVMLMKQTSSVLAIGYMFVITMLPSVFLAPLGGVLIDRYNKATISIVCNLARFVLIGIIPLLVYLNHFSIFIMYISIFFGYIAWYINVPANESMLKEVLSEDEYVQGVSLTQAAWQVGLLSSALIAGALMKYVGTTETFVVAALTFGIGGLLFFRIHHVYTKNTSATEQAPSKLDVKQYMGDIKEGFRYIITTKKVFWFSLCACMSFPFIMSINVLIAPFTYQVIHGNEFTLGVLDSGAGIGSLISAFICLSISKRKELPFFLTISIILLGISTVLFSLSTSMLIAFIMYIVIGIFMGNLKVLAKSLVYKYVEESFVGRTMTTISMLSLSIAIVFSLLMGVLGQKGVTLAYDTLACTLVLGILFVLFGSYHVRQEEKMARRAGVTNDSGQVPLR